MEWLTSRCVQVYQTLLFILYIAIIEAFKIFKQMALMQICDAVKQLKDLDPDAQNKIIDYAIAKDQAKELRIQKALDLSNENKKRRENKRLELFKIINSRDEEVGKLDSGGGLWSYIAGETHISVQSKYAATAEEKRWARLELAKLEEEEKEEEENLQRNLVALRDI